MVEVKSREIEKIEGKRTCGECHKELIKLKSGKFKCFKCNLEFEFD